MKPRSMEEKISYLLFLMGFAGLVCTAALCIFVFHKAFREQAWTALEREADLVAALRSAPFSAPARLRPFLPLTGRVFPAAGAAALPGIPPARRARRTIL